MRRIRSVGRGWPSGNCTEPFHLLVGFESFFERLEPARRRIEPHVPRGACEVDEVFPVQIERGDRVKLIISVALGARP